MWQIQILNTYYVLFNTDKQGQTIVKADIADGQPNALSHIVALSAGITLLSSGIVLTVLRLREPLFQFVVVQKIYAYFGEEYIPGDSSFGSEAERQFATDSLSTFLSSSLNVELVFVILKSITERAKEDLMSDMIGMDQDACPYKEFVHVPLKAHENQLSWAIRAKLRHETKKACLVWAEA